MCLSRVCDKLERSFVSILSFFNCHLFNSIFHFATVHQLSFHTPSFIHFFLSFFPSFIEHHTRCCHLQNQRCVIHPLSLPSRPPSLRYQLLPKVSTMVPPNPMGASCTKQTSRQSSLLLKISSGLPASPVLGYIPRS